jgi:hypothetical protein
VSVPDESFPPDPQKIRIRPHMPAFAFSMAGTCYIADAADVLAYINCFYPEKHARMSDLAQRYFGPDIRNGWDSWLISSCASPILWADKPVPGIPELQPLREVSGIDLST